MEDRKVHPVIVEGFDGTLEELANKVAGLRFDAQAEFNRFYEAATRRNAQRDEEVRGLKELPRELRIGAGQIKSVSDWFCHLFERYKKHMKHELQPEM